MLADHRTDGYGPLLVRVPQVENCSFTAIILDMP